MADVKFFDVHTHLNMQFDDDWQEVGDQTLANGFQFVNVGADLFSSKKAIEQAKYFGDNGYCTVGLHPTESSAEDFSEIAKLAENEHVVAIGECGLEYYRIDDPLVKEKQKELFKKHIELAIKLDKPVMIHCRATLNNTRANRDSEKIIDAHQDILEIVSEYKKQAGERFRFNMHFFTGTWEIAQKFAELGGFFSFNGVLTFTDQYDEIVRKLPLGQILSETDAPFVAPEPYRGKRNEPAYVEFAAKKIAELRPESDEEVLVTLVKNAQEFYRLV